MLRRLYINNFRCFVNLELQLPHSALILGRNGAGKSSLLDALLYLQSFVCRNRTAWDTWRYSNTRWIDLPTLVCELEIEGGSNDRERYLYRLEIELDSARQRARVFGETVHSDRDVLFSFLQGEVQLYRDDGSAGPKFSYDWSRSGLTAVMPGSDNKRLTWFKLWLERLQFLRLVPQLMSVESASEDPLLLLDGRNFASWYRHVFQEDPGIVRPLFEVLSKMVDGFDSLDLMQAGERRLLKVHHRINGKDYDIGFGDLSDGQRVLIVLYTMLGVLRRRSSPVMVLVDELGFAVTRSPQLISPLTDLLIVLQHAIHRPKRADVDALLGEGVEDLGRCSVSESRAVEHREYIVALLLIERSVAIPLGFRGSHRSLISIEAGPR